ncbi:unnamed protein product, partial [Musa banksii]
PRSGALGIAAKEPRLSRKPIQESSHPEEEKSGRKETVHDLAKFIDKGVQVKLTGGRQGYDQLLNLVLDKATEFLRDPDDPLKTTDQTRRLGLIIRRGPAVMLVSPTDGTDEIANPFIQLDGTRCRFYLLACSLLGSEQYSDNRRKKARHE